MPQGAEEREVSRSSPKRSMPPPSVPGTLGLVEAREVLESLAAAGELARIAAGVAAAAREYAADLGDAEGMELADSGSTLASAANLDAEEALYFKVEPMKALDAAMKAAGAAAVALRAAQRAFEGKERD